MCVYEFKTHKSYACYKSYSSNFSEILDFVHIDLHSPQMAGVTHSTSNAGNDISTVNA